MGRDKQTVRHTDDHRQTAEDSQSVGASLAVDPVRRDVSAAAAQTPDLGK